MKKIAIMAMTAIAALTITSCDGNRPAKADLKSDIDSLSYAGGVSLGQRFNQYQVLKQMEIDSIYMGEFMKGLQDAVRGAEDKKNSAYYAGVNIGFSLNEAIKQLEGQFFENDSTKKISRENYLAAFLQVIQNKEALMTAEAADSVMHAVEQKLQEQRYSENKKLGEEFLANKAKEEGVKATGSGLLYKVLTEGNGPVATSGDVVKVTYEGRLVDGEVFDSTEKHGGEPAEFPVGSTVAGFDEAMQMMPVGSEWELYLPYDLAYGENGTPNGMIKPYSALIFKLKIVEIVKK